MIFNKYINLYVFLISLALGIFAVYITTPESRIIYVYPTPENVEHLQYKDKAENCFSFTQSEVDCPFTSDNITKIPAQY